MCHTTPWQVISADILGKLPVTKEGNYAYIIVVTDLFTRQVEVKALVKVDSRAIADMLVDEVFCRYGCPDQILTDQGANFCDALIHELCAAMEVRKIRTSAYNPQCNGVTERFNKTLANMLAKYIDRYHNDWHLFLQPVVAAYRSAVHSTTLETPFYLTYGRVDSAIPTAHYDRAATGS